MSLAIGMGTTFVIGAGRAHAHDQAVRDHLVRRGSYAVATVTAVTNRSRTDRSLDVDVKIADQGAPLSVDLGDSQYLGIEVGERLSVVFDPDDPNVTLPADVATKDPDTYVEAILPGVFLLIAGFLVPAVTLFFWITSRRNTAAGPAARRQPF